MRPIVSNLRDELAVAEAKANEAAEKAASWQAVHLHETEKTAKIRALLAIYEGEGVEEDGGEQQMPLPLAAAVVEAPVVPAPVSIPVPVPPKGLRVIREVSNLLQLHGSLHRRRILDHLIEAGVLGHEKDPLASLAAYLSENKHMFLSDGQGNFFLRPGLEAGKAAVTPAHDAAAPKPPAEEANLA